MAPNYRLALALAISGTVHAALLGAVVPTYVTQFSSPASPSATLEVRLGSLERGTESIQETPLEVAQEPRTQADDQATLQEALAPALPLPTFDQYVPSRELDIRPQAADPIIVPFPDETPLGRPKAAVILALYISATGMVERVEAEKSDLPPAFVEAAKKSFLYARMHPGMKGGRPVAARMRIEVEFTEGR